MTTLIAEVKRNALDDGPGIRSVVFFKGCPLSCVWCQNPEARSPGQELAYHAERCLGCGRCREACQEGALDFSDCGYQGNGKFKGSPLSPAPLSPSGERGPKAAYGSICPLPPGRGEEGSELLKHASGYPVDRSRCALCGACVQACTEGALVFVGKEYDVDNLVKMLARDAVFYRNTDGGVTLSGGEPTMHAAYLGELLTRLKDLGIPVCLETCGHYDRGTFERAILPYLDLIYFDLKLADEDQHARFCGRDNRTIRANFEALVAQSRVAVLPRIPLVPGITATAENLKGLREYLTGLSISRVAFLPYNPLWLSKLGPLGMKAAYTHTTWMDQTEKERVRDVFQGFEMNPF